MRQGHVLDIVMQAHATRFSVVRPPLTPPSYSVVELDFRPFSSAVCSGDMSSGSASQWDTYAKHL